MTPEQQIKLIVCVGLCIDYLIFRGLPLSFRTGFKLLTLKLIMLHIAGWQVQQLYLRCDHNIYNEQWHILHVWK